MGGLLDFEFDETYLGLTAGTNTVNPVGDAASDPDAARRSRRDRGRPRQRACHLPRGADREHPDRRRRGLRRLLLAGAQPAERDLAASSPTTSRPTWSAASSTSSSTASRLNYAELQNAWAGRSVTAPMQPGQRTTGRYQLIVGPWEHLNGSSVDVDPLELEWFDTWLKHERTGMAQTPTPLHYYDLGSGQFDETATLSVHRRHADAHVPRLGRHAQPVGAADHLNRRPVDVEPRRQPVRAPDRPVGDGRDLDPRAHGRVAGAVRRRRPAVRRSGRGRRATRSAPFTRAQADRRTDHRDDLRELDDARDAARRRARGRHAQRRRRTR